MHQPTGVMMLSARGESHVWWPLARKAMPNQFKMGNVAWDDPILVLRSLRYNCRSVWGFFASRGREKLRFMCLVQNLCLLLTELFWKCHITRQVWSRLFLHWQVKEVHGQNRTCSRRLIFCKVLELSKKYGCKPFSRYIFYKASML